MPINKEIVRVISYKYFYYYPIKVLSNIIKARLFPPYFT